MKNTIIIGSIVRTKILGSGYIYKSYIKDIKESNGINLYLIASSDKWWKENEIILIRR